MNEVRVDLLHASNGRARQQLHDLDQVLKKHGIPALRELAAQRCKRSNCGTVCLCGPCHARKALEVLDPEWRP